jgi:ASC-1-like (ASCH) protein
MIGLVEGMKHSMKLYAEPFERVATGKKVIEVRLNDMKRREVSVGDEIEFTLFGGNSIVLVKVIGLSQFASFSDLYEAFDCATFGHPAGTLLKDQLLGVRKTYSEADELKFGVLGIHILL